MKTTSREVGSASKDRRDLNVSDGEPPATILIVLAFGAVYLIWGSTYLGIKYAIQTIPPFLMAATRFLTAGLILFSWAKIKSRRGGDDNRVSGEHLRRAFVIGALLLLCGNGGVTWAERFIPSGLAALFVSTEPFWVVMISWTIGGGRPHRMVLLGLLTGMAGVTLLMSGGFVGASSTGVITYIGAVVLILASLAWASGSVYALWRPVQTSPVLAAGLQMLAGGTLLLILALVTGEFGKLSLKNASWTSLAAFAYLTVFGSLIGFTAYSWLLRKVAPAHAATYAYVNPVVAVILGWLIASEPVTPRMLLAAAVIVGSVVLITTYSEPPSVSVDSGSELAPVLLAQSSEQMTDQELEEVTPCPTHPCA